MATLTRLGLLLALSVWWCGLLVRVRGEGRSQRDGCTVPYQPSNIRLNDTHTRIVCQVQSSSLRWTKATDLCDPSTFTNYDACNDMGSTCNIPSSEYLDEENTFFCCESTDPGGDRQCKQLVAAPTVTFEVPVFVRRGMKETAYAVVTSKPRPSMFPPVNMILELVVDGGTHLKRINMSSTEIVSSSMNPLKFIIIYSFVIPTDVAEGTTLRFSVEPINEWTINGSFSFEAIPVITVSGPSPPTSTVTTSPAVNSTDGEGTDVTSTTVDRAAIAIPLLSVLCGILLVGVVVCSVLSLVCFSLLKKKDKMLKNSLSSDSSPPTVNTPTVLNLYPDPSPNANSTVTSPGQTPQTETTGLLSGSAGGVAHDHGTTVIVTSLCRQNSRDSGLMTTPTESEQPFPGPTGMTSFAGSNGNDPERHIYSTIGQVFESVDTRAAPPTTDSQQLSQLYLTTPSDSMVHAHSSTASLSSGSELFRPPLPADKPGYASHGSMMHLLPQEQLRTRCYVSNV